MQVRAQTSSDGASFLSGAVVERWFAPSLRSAGPGSLADWTDQDIARFLQTGANHTGIAFGSMNDVVSNSTQYLSEADALAIARYLKTLRDSDIQHSQFAYDETTDRGLRAGNASQRGALLYLDNCAACHRPDGRGYAEVFPALAGNPVVESDQALSLISIVLSGSTTTRTQATPAQFHMPSFEWRLSDEEIADVASFIRSSWGNRAAPVNAKEVEERRAQLVQTQSTTAR